MGNSSQNKTNELLRQQQVATQSRYNPALEDLNKRSNDAYTDSQSRVKGLSDSYGKLAETGGFDPGAFDALRGTFGGGGGGSSVANYLSDTGGIDESKFADALS